MQHDGVYNTYQRSLKKQNKLNYIRKPVAEYSKKDFVLYFKKKYEEVYELPYHEINVPAACNVIGTILVSFYKAGFDNEIVLKFVDYELRKGKTDGRNVRLRTLQYGVGDFLFKLKKSKDEFKASKEDLEKLVETEEEIWGLLKKKWNKK